VCLPLRGDRLRIKLPLKVLDLALQGSNVLSLSHWVVVPWHEPLDCCGCLLCRQQKQYPLVLHFQLVDRGGGLVGGGSGSCCGSPLCLLHIAIQVIFSQNLLFGNAEFFSKCMYPKRPSSGFFFEKFSLVVCLLCTPSN
jgi:hypothetical protein